MTVKPDKYTKEAIGELKRGIKMVPEYIAQKHYKQLGDQHRSVEQGLRKRIAQLEGELEWYIGAEPVAIMAYSVCESDTCADMRILAPINSGDTLYKLPPPPEESE